MFAILKFSLNFKKLRDIPYSRILLCLFVAFSVAGCKADLFSKVDEIDANAALGALYSEGIAATKVSAGEGVWRVEVEDKDLQRALFVTHNQQIPRARFESMGDIFKKDGLVSTPSEMRMRYIYAVSQELSNTLSHIDGVISARVQPVIPAADPMSDKTKPASASVFIKYTPDADLQQMAPAIKNLVSHSIEGLSPDNVSLTFFASKPLSASIHPPPASPLSDPLVSTLAALLAACVAAICGYIAMRLWKTRPSAGPGAAVVSPQPWRGR